MSNTVTTQTLGLKGSFFDDLVAGRQIWTIRDGEKDIESGFLMYQNSDKIPVTAYVWVTDVLHLNVKGASVKTGQKLDDLLTDLRQFYPTITGDDKVTLILHLTVDQTKKMFPVPNPSSTTV